MKRIQLKRTRGWRKPPNAIAITRPHSPLANRHVLKKHGGPYTMDESLTLYQKDLRHWAQHDRARLEAVRGKDLACWCKLSDRCHGDLLLEWFEENP